MTCLLVYTTLLFRQNAKDEIYIESKSQCSVGTLYLIVIDTYIKWSHTLITKSIFGYELYLLYERLYFLSHALTRITQLPIEHLLTLTYYPFKR